ncbi:hypothetical protein ACIOD2_31285 [Amycolatopsis sp. NPDC088138]|uniref:hypothetical protein n=1 Tax=Amycolatopsis sp. NPDC088138 TaxID=3363938 RepID=UPI0038060C69
MTVPDRAQVARTWTELIAGRITRADAHAWAVPWVEDEPERVADPMCRTALLHLHGFDQAWTGDDLVGHGVSLDWLHSDEDIASAFTRWRTAAAEYDRDPAGHVAGIRRRTLAQRRRPES